MKIDKIVEKHYDEFKKMSLRPDNVVSGGKTSDDVLSDIIYTALKKYKGKEIEEEEGVVYIRKSFLNEIRFQYKRLKMEKVVLMTSLPDIEDE